MNLHTGALGEELACKYLRKKGYRIVERNFKSALGELDIICKFSNFLIFTEVKTRKSLRCGHPIEAVDFRKQQRIRKIALFYLQNKKLFDKPCRFDVIGVEMPQGKITHIENAF